MRLLSTILITVIACFLAQIAPAQTTPKGNACSGPLSGDDFRRLSAVSGSGMLAPDDNPAMDKPEPMTAYLPSGSIATFSMPTPGAPQGQTAPELTYRAFAMPTGSTGDTTTVLVVLAVTKTDQDTRLSVWIPVTSRGAKLIERTSFLLVGCRKASDGSGELSADNEPEQLALITHKITLRWSGIVWAVLTGAFILAIVGGYAYRQKKKLGSFWRGLLYAFSNFRQQVSLSLVQLFIFTAAVAVMVAWHFGRTWQLTNLSTDVLYLLGISAAGATAGAWADISKNRLKWENWHWLKQRGAFNENLATIPLNLGQLVTTRGEFDLYRFQALLFTLLVAPAFIVSSLYSLDTAAIPEGILSVLGLSQVTYLVGKMADTPTVTDFDTSLAETIKQVKAGNRLTQAGFDRLKAEFRAAMGIDWAGTTTQAADVLGDDGAADVATAAKAELAARQTTFKTAHASATDQTKLKAALPFVDASATSELAMSKAERLRDAALFSDQAVEAAIAARDAARKATEALDSAIAALAP